MSFTKRLSLNAIFIVLSLSLCVQACGQGGPKGNESPPSPPPPKGAAEQVAADGWQRFQLDGKNGDWISVLLPQKPEEFPGGKFRVSPQIQLPVHLYLLSRDAKSYFVLFIELPKDAGELTADVRGDIFFGCWNGAAARVREVLEEKFGGSFEVAPGRQQVGEIKGGERRMQSFKLGTQSGRAQAMFVGRRAYMLVAVWDTKPESEQDAARFLDSFQVRLDGR